MLVVTLRLSPWHSSCRFLPSKETQAVFLLSGDTEIFNSTPAGTTIGLQSSYDVWWEECMINEIRCMHGGSRKGEVAPEGERVWTDGGDHNCRDTRVDHAGTSGHCIGCTSRRGGHDQAIALITHSVILYLYTNTWTR